MTENVAKHRANHLRLNFLVQTLYATSGQYTECEDHETVIHHSH